MSGHLVAEGAAGILKRGAGPAEQYGARAAAADVDPKQLRAMLTYPPEWGPSEWGEPRCRMDAPSAWGTYLFNPREQPGSQLGMG